MKTKLPALDLLFPKVRAEILRLLFFDPKRQRYVRELMTMSGLALRTIQEELATLTAVGVITSWSNGYHRFYRANRTHPLFPHLLALVHTSGRLSNTTLTPASPAPAQERLTPPPDLRSEHTTNRGHQKSDGSFKTRLVKPVES